MSTITSPKPFKSLTQFTEPIIDQVFEKYGVFFAFSDQQFNEKKQPGVDYVSVELGAICPKKNAVEFLKEFEQKYDAALKEFLAYNDEDKIIRYELANYECYYVGDYLEAFQILKGYGITDEKKVSKIFNDQMQIEIEAGNI